MPILHYRNPMRELLSNIIKLHMHLKNDVQLIYMLFALDMQIQMPLSTISDQRL